MELRVGGVGGMCKCLKVCLCMSLYGGTSVGVYNTCVRSKRASHTRSSKAITYLTCLQKTRACTCCATSWDARMGAPSRPWLQFYLIECGAKKRKMGSGGKGYLKAPFFFASGPSCPQRFSSPKPLERIPPIQKHTKQTNTPLESLRTLSPSNQHVSLVSPSPL